jgi:cob(I)alamin adenosyltransferase
MAPSPRIHGRHSRRAAYAVILAKGSIATTRGDGGQTGLAGGVRVSKADLRVEAYGTIDELNASIGAARSICGDRAIGELAHSIQRELFKVGSALATPPESPKPPTGKEGNRWSRAW